MYSIFNLLLFIYLLIKLWIDWYVIKSKICASNYAVMVVYFKLFGNQ